MRSRCRHFHADFQPVLRRSTGLPVEIRARTRCKARAQVRHHANLHSSCRHIATNSRSSKHKWPGAREREQETSANKHHQSQQTSLARDVPRRWRHSARTRIHSNLNRREIERVNCTNSCKRNRSFVYHSYVRGIRSPVTTNITVNISRSVWSSMTDARKRQVSAVRGQLSRDENAGSP